jgi:hypothetical protein
MLLVLFLEVISYYITLFLLFIICAFFLRFFVVSVIGLLAVVSAD